jgi:hypothetical protein
MEACHPTHPSAWLGEIMNELCHVTLSLRPLDPPHPFVSSLLVTSTHWLYWLLEDQKKKGVRERRKKEKKKRVL